MALLGVIVLATVLASFTDWLFFDVLVHRYYQAAPAIWRPGGTSRIVLSQLIATMASAAAVWVALLAPGRPVLVALGLWAAGSLPMALQNAQWMWINPAVTANHALGWLVRLLIATVLTALLL